MSKKRRNVTQESEQRLSRKEILRARKQEEQRRWFYIGGAIVLGLLLLVIISGAVIELVFVPRQAVALVGEQQISLGEWQERMRYERAQRIVFLENQLEAFGGDVGIVQQFGGQAINDLFDPEGLGQTVINSMANELVICQALAERGVEITEADIDTEIAQNFNYFEGDSPTPQPTATETVVPTPSITPIPTAVITEVVPTETPFPTATAGPTFTPQPTATPVSEEAFQTEYGDFLAQFNELGIDEATYRGVVRTQLCRERLAEVLAEEQEVAQRVPHASLFLLTFDNEEEANDAAAEIEETDFLTVWNTIRSRPPEASDVPLAEQDLPTAEEEEQASTAEASELLWRTQDTLAGSIGEAVAEEAFSLSLNEPSEVITETAADGSTSYVLLMVSGREERDLSETEYNNVKQENLQLFVDQQLAERLQIRDTWRNRVPTVPVLDSKFLAPPTPTPIIPTTVPIPVEETPQPEPTEEAPPDDGQAPATEATAEPADDEE